MRIKEGFVLREVAGQNVVVAVGKQAVNFNGMITLNSTAKFLWQLLQTEKNQNELIEALCEKYDVNQDKAQLDVTKFISQLRAAHIIE